MSRSERIVRDLELREAGAMAPSRGKAMLELRCVLHPTYRGILRPRVECAGCQMVYDMRQREAKQNGLRA